MCRRNCNEESQKVKKQNVIFFNWITIGSLQLGELHSSLGPLTRLTNKNGKKEEVRNEGRKEREFIPFMPTF